MRKLNAKLTPLVLGDSDYFPSWIWSDAASYNDITNNIEWFHSAPTTFEWAVTPQPNGDYLFHPLEIGIKDPADSGNDIIYAGAGDDFVWAGAGDRFWLYCCDAANDAEVRMAA